MRTKYVQVSNSQVCNEQRLLSWQCNRGLHRVKHHPFLCNSSPSIAVGSPAQRVGETDAWWPTHHCCWKQNPLALSTFKRQTTSNHLQTTEVSSGAAAILQLLPVLPGCCSIWSHSVATLVKCPLETVPFQELHKQPMRSSTLPLLFNGRKFYFLISLPL